MFCKHCHYEFYVPGDSLGAKVRCPNCTVTLRVENRSLICSCPECGEMLDVALWMIGSASNCPHCQKEIVLSLGEDFIKYFPDSPKQTEMLDTASKKAGDIIGKYRVLRCLGIGGMGEVYLVEHTLLNTRCALKLLKKDVAKDDPEMRARLLREARLASQIQHPNLIAVLDAELEENSSDCYIVMEYVDGVSIESILADGPMLEARALEIISQVAEALKVAAANHIIHRDIKPANIMLSRTGEVKVADLGIAKVESDSKHNMTLTMDNAILGTPNYASPEQLRSSHQVDCRADIYSLGVTLFHMLTGKRPFESESVFGVMANVLEKDLPMTHEVNPAVSMKTSILIARMTEKKRDERPENFDVLLRELRTGKKKERGSKLKKIKSSDGTSGFKKIWQLFLVTLSIICLIVSGLVIYNKMTVSGVDGQEDYDPDFMVRKDNMLLDKTLTTLFKVDKKASRVVIPDSVHTIAGYAFQDAVDVEEVILPQWLNKIEESAFANCRKLEKLTIPATVSEINTAAFHGVKKIELAPGNRKFRLTRDGGLVDLSNQTLLYVPPRVRRFTIPDYITKISEAVFKECRQLTEIEIPESVTDLRNKVFMDCENLTAVNIKGAVVYIPDNAFSNCVKLKTVVLPDTVRSIGRAAFENCSSLDSLNLTDSITHIGFNAFKGCPELSGIRLPSNLPKYHKRSHYGLDNEEKKTVVPVSETPSSKSVSASETASSSTVFPASAAETSSPGDYRLSSGGETLLEWTNKNVSRAVVPAGVKKIGGSAFSSNKMIKSVKLPDGLTDIGRRSFKGCENLSEINIPGTVTVIRTSAFEGCVNLDLELPASVNTLGSKAFFKVKSVKLAPGNRSFKMDEFGAIIDSRDKTMIYLPKIREYKIPDGVKMIPYALCAGNTELQSIEIPDSVQRVTSNAFADCSNLKSITIPAHLSSSSSNWGLPSSCRIKIAGANSTTSAAAAPAPSQTSKEAENFQLSGDGRILEKCLDRKIKTAVIPRGVTEIKRGVFNNCHYLESVVIPEGVTKIGGNAFFYCHKLKSVTLPDSLIEIGDRAFGRCMRLDITIPQNVQTIGNGAFGHIRGVGLDKRNRHFKMNNGVLFNRAGTRLLHAPEKMDSYMVPSGVTAIDAYAFARCRDLSRVVLPDGLKVIGAYAFNSRRNLKSVNLPDSLTEIGEYAFSGCKNLKFTIPAKVHDIGDGAFKGISSIKLSSANRNFKLDSYGAIVKADNSEIINVPEHIRHYAVPYGVKTIPWDMFSNRKNLTSVKIPDSVIEIKSYAFRNCDNLELTLPKSIRHIGQDAFSGVKSVKLEAGSPYFKYDPQGILINIRYGEIIYIAPEVTEIKIPAGVKRVGYGVFRNCKKLKRIYLPANLMSRKQYMGIPRNVDVLQSR